MPHEPTFPQMEKQKDEIHLLFQYALLKAHSVLGCVKDIPVTQTKVVMQTDSSKPSLKEEETLISGPHKAEYLLYRNRTGPYWPRFF